MSAGGEVDVNYYAVLDVKEDATAQEIKTAYRKRSLKVHPDRNPDNPEAASLFDALKKAYEILCDPATKATFDALLVARNARKLRFQGLDNKRKALAEDLDRREKEFKRSKAEELKERGELERLKDEGRRMREAREAGALEQEAKADGVRRDEYERKRRAEDTASRTGAVELGPLDTTLRVKWAPGAHPDVLDAASLQAKLKALVAPSPLDVDSVVFSAKFKANPAKGKHASAVVAFRSLRAAVRVVEASTSTAWGGIEIAWAAGVPPAVLGGPKLAEQPKAEPKPTTLPAVMVVDSSEDRILAQLRAKERQKLMEQMRKNDE